MNPELEGMCNIRSLAAALAARDSWAAGLVRPVPSASPGFVPEDYIVTNRGVSDIFSINRAIGRAETPNADAGMRFLPLILQPMSVASSTQLDASAGFHCSDVVATGDVLRLWNQQKEAVVRVTDVSQTWIRFAQDALRNWYTGEPCLLFGPCVPNAMRLALTYASRQSPFQQTIGSEPYPYNKDLYTTLYNDVQALGTEDQYANALMKATRIHTVSDIAFNGSGLTAADVQQIADARLLDGLNIAASNVDGERISAQSLTVSGKAVAESFSALSDARIKRDISAVDANAEFADYRAIADMNVVNFSYMSDPLHTKRIGVIAQEIERVLPRAVVDAPTSAKLHGVRRGAKNIVYATPGQSFFKSIPYTTLVVDDREFHVLSIDVDTMAPEISIHIEGESELPVEVSKLAELRGTILTVDQQRVLYAIVNTVKHIQRTLISPTAEF